MLKMVDIVSLLKVTELVPTQWEISLSNGLSLYVRYRFGSFQVSRLNDLLAHFYVEQVGKPFDGHMTSIAMLEHLKSALPKIGLELAKIGQNENDKD